MLQALFITLRQDNHYMKAVCLPERTSLVVMKYTVYTGFTPRTSRMF